MGDLSEFLEDSPRGFAWAAAKQAILKEELVPHCRAPCFVNAQARAVARSHQEAQEEGVWGHFQH